MALADLVTAYSSTEGKELAPGVRQVDLGDRESLIPGIQPGASTPETEMSHDMVCHLTAGELAVRQNGKQFTAKMGDVWSCSKGVNTEARSCGSSIC